MKISELRCPNCDLSIKKEIPICEFCRLSEEDYEFLIIFLRSRGRITEMERLLGLSYPSIKQKIDNLLTRLKLTPLEEFADPIDALAQGKISVDEAVVLLKKRRH